VRGQLPIRSNFRTVESTGPHRGPGTSERSTHICTITKHLHNHNASARPPHICTRPPLYGFCSTNIGPRSTLLESTCFSFGVGSRIAAEKYG
jgi:hypothetical protein